MEKWELAFEDWKHGMKYKEIADKYTVSLNTVKSWASRKWKQFNKKKVADKNDKRLQHKAKAGAPKNNKNAIGNKGGSAPKNNKNAVGNLGGSAPKGNKNNLKHGIYEKLLYSALSEEEKALFQLNSLDEVEEIKETIHLCNIQIMKFLRKIKEIEDKPGGLLADSASVTNSKHYNKSLDKMELCNSITTTNTTASHNLILKYSAEIERIKKQKIKCLDILIKMRDEKEEKISNINVDIYIPDNKRK